MTSRRAISPRCSHGILRTWPIAMIAPSPGLMIGVPASTPNTPTFVSVKVPPARSAGDSRPSRARPVRSRMASASSLRLIAWASLTFGTISPRGVAAAKPRLTKFCCTIVPAASSHRALTSGVRSIATRHALAASVMGVSLTSRNSREALSSASSSMVSVTSTCRNSVTCGAVNADCTMAAAVALRTPLTGTASVRGRPPRVRTPPVAADSAPDWGGVAAAAGCPPPARNASTSARVMTPPAPVPVTCSRSTPARRAYRRTGGVHRGRSPEAASGAASARAGSAASGCGRPAPAGAASDVDGACPRAGSPTGAADVAGAAEPRRARRPGLPVSGAAP